MSRIPVVSRFPGNHVTLPHKVAHQGQQWLSVVQKYHLAKLCLLHVGLGHPPTHVQIKALGLRIASESGDEQPLGRE